MEGWTVAVERSGGGWRAVVRDPRGADVLDRTCASEEEARTFASTVVQHLRWLSEARFGEYYRVEEA